MPALFSFAAERRYLVLIKPCVSKNGLTRLLDRFQLALIRESGGADQKRVLRSIVSWYQEMWPALLPTASVRSAAPDCASCPGNPCIRSMFHRWKPAVATMSSARRASLPEWIRPKYGARGHQSFARQY